MDIEQLYIDYSIPHSTGGHKHVQPGWVGTPCPFCTGNPGYHLGYNKHGNYFYCWRCGGHQVMETLSKILKTNGKRTKEIIREYGGTHTSHQKTTARINESKKDFTFPSGCTSLQSNHRQYLLRRGFDPDRLEREWGLLGTGPLSRLDGIDFRYRIVAPIRWNGDTVSFQARDITDKTAYKYFNCPKDRELVHLKQILYGDQKAWNGTGICVEGVTDVWRFGKNAFATFGIEYTQQQIREIGRHFKQVFVLFDNEPKAQWKGRVLLNALKERYRIIGEQIPIKGDPGSMPQDEADYLIKQLIKWKQTES